MKEKIIIYGAGNYGKKMYHFLKKRGVDIDCFCVSEDMNESLFDVPVISKKTFFKMENEAIVLICIGNVEISQHIKREIKMHFFDKMMVVECGDFIKEYLDNNGKKYCIACNSYINEFKPHGISTIIHEKFKMSGSGYRENCRCPKCQSIDRTRWMIYVLKKYTDIINDECRVLHFAPTNQVRKFIEKNKKCDYYMGDIDIDRANHRINVLDIQFRDETFDYVIINHVLEHVEQEDVAIHELKRILRPNGKIIMSVPICLDQVTYENAQYNTPELRLKFYGLEQHVRLYGRDYKEHFEKYGLDIQVYMPKLLCNKENAEKYGFLEDDIVMICTKKEL